jgi:hypothetical protein
MWWEDRQDPTQRDIEDTLYPIYYCSQKGQAEERFTSLHHLLGHLWRIGDTTEKCVVKFRLEEKGVKYILSQGDVDHLQRNNARQHTLHPDHKRILDHMREIARTRCNGCIQGQTFKLSPHRQRGGCLDGESMVRLYYMNVVGNVYSSDHDEDTYLKEIGYYELTRYNCFVDSLF